MLLSLNLEAGRLRDVDHLLELSVQERQFHIHVVDWPSLRRRVTEQQSDGLESSHRCKNLIEVDPMALDVAFGDEACLVLGDVARSVALGLLDPLEPDRTLSRWRIHELPRSVRLDRHHLIKHCLALAPTLALLGLGKGGRLVIARQ